MATARPPTNNCRDMAVHSHYHMHILHSVPPPARSGARLALRFGALPGTRKQAARQRRATCRRLVAVDAGGQARLDGTAIDSVLGLSRRLAPSVNDPERERTNGTNGTNRTNSRNRTNEQDSHTEKQEY